MKPIDRSDSLIGASLFIIDNLTRIRLIFDIDAATGDLDAHLS